MLKADARACETTNTCAFGAPLAPPEGPLDARLDGEGVRNRSNLDIVRARFPRTHGPAAAVEERNGLQLHHDNDQKREWERARDAGREAERPRKCKALLRASNVAARRGASCTPTATRPSQREDGESAPPRLHACVSARFQSRIARSGLAALAALCASGSAASFADDHPPAADQLVTAQKAPAVERPRRYELAGFPIIGGNSDIGFQFGAAGTLTRFSIRRSLRVEPRLAALGEPQGRRRPPSLAQQSHVLRLDAPDIFGGRAASIHAAAFSAPSTPATTASATPRSPSRPREHRPLLVYPRRGAGPRDPAGAHGLVGHGLRRRREPPIRVAEHLRHVGGGRALEARRRFDRAGRVGDRDAARVPRRRHPRDDRTTRARASSSRARRLLSARDQRHRRDGGARRLRRGVGGAGPLRARRRSLRLREPLRLQLPVRAGAVLRSRARGRASSRSTCSAARTACAACPRAVTSAA